MTRSGLLLGAALALPLHSKLSDTDLDWVAESLDKLVSSH